MAQDFPLPPITDTLEDARLKHNDAMASQKTSFSGGVAPPLPFVGQLWYDDSAHAIFIWNGTIWEKIPTGAGPGFSIQTQALNQPVLAPSQYTTEKFIPIMVAPQGGMVVHSAQLTVNKTTVGSALEKRWRFTVYNSSTSLGLASQPLRTDTAEMIADIPQDMTLNQNLAVTQGQVLNFSIQAFTAGGTPTSFAGDEFVLALVWTPNIP